VSAVDEMHGFVPLHFQTNGALVFEQGGSRVRVTSSEVTDGTHLSALRGGVPGEWFCRLEFLACSSIPGTPGGRLLGKIAFPSLHL
jgi:hypothetical protein